MPRYSPLSQLVLISQIIVLAIPASAAKPPPARWVRIHVNGTLPSQVFARLGLTHITRRGYTRDGAKKTDPDPTFPAGLIDVVPSDIEHVLLVRGTEKGIAGFRAQVLAAETQLAAVRWHVQAELLQTQPGGGVSVTLGSPWQGDIPDNSLVQITLGDPARSYQILVRPAGAGGMSVQWQAGLSLTNTPPAPGVYAPPVAWTPAQTQVSTPTVPVSFDDLAAGRRSAREALSLPADQSTEDYQVRITITPLVTLPAAPMPAAPAALPLPLPPAATGKLE